MSHSASATVLLEPAARTRRSSWPTCSPGLRRSPKELPCKYFYDERGSQLFDEICELDEYYLTRTEDEIIKRHAQEMADQIGPGVMLVEYGSGSSTKTRALLDRLADPVAYVPVDISREHLRRTAAQLVAGLSADRNAAGVRGLYQAVPPARVAADADAQRRVLSGLDDRQFPAARSAGDARAPRRDVRHGRRAADRHRPAEGRRARSRPRTTTPAA